MLELLPVGVEVVWTDDDLHLVVSADHLTGSVIMASRDVVVVHSVVAFI